MNYLRLQKDRMILRGDDPAPWELRTFRRKDGSHSFPICGDIYRRLRSSMALTVDDDLKVAFLDIARGQRLAMEAASLEDCDIPGGEGLRPYQRTGAQWLCLVKRGVLADEQGTGKTVTALTAARLAAPTRALILCSNSKKQDWGDHAREWGGAPVAVLHGGPSRRDQALEEWKEGYLVAGYGTASAHLEDLQGRVDLVIVDEAHTLRNKDTRLFSAIRAITRRAEYVFLLTASPTVNKLTDLWPLLDICDPKRFSSYWGFVYRFCEVEDDGYGLKVGGIRPGEEGNVQRIMKPYVLHREGMLDLPACRHRVHPYRMSSEQADLYQCMKRDGTATLGGEVAVALSDLSLITRLRQMAIHPGLVFEGYQGPSKLDALLEVVQERGTKAIAFTQFAAVADRAAALLSGHGIEALAYTGAMSEQQRNAAEAAFRRGSAQVLILTHGVGGEGLNLVEAERVIFIDLAWHPAGNLHALKRILRIGQTSADLEAVYLLAEGTIENHVWAIVRGKRPVTIEALMALDDLEHRGATESGDE